MTLDEQISANAALIIEHLSGPAGFTLGYDERSVEWLDGFIERQRSKEDFDMEASGTLISMVGCFLGEAIREETGASWSQTDHGLGIVFANGNVAYPLTKAEKHFLNGAEDGDSIFGFYSSSLAIASL